MRCFTEAALADYVRLQQVTPIDMVLHCPKCGLQHIDKPEGQFYPGHTADESVAANKAFGCWHNPPHRSHLCHGCNYVWRPADVPTNGVAAVQTRGKADWPLVGEGQPVIAWRYYLQPGQGPVFTANREEAFLYDKNPTPLVAGVIVDHALSTTPVVDHEAPNLNDNAAGVPASDQSQQEGGR